VDEAQSDIEASLALVPDNRDADALLAVISVVKNDKPTLSRCPARDAAERDLAAGLIALSYAQQASFEPNLRWRAERAAELAPAIPPRNRPPSCSCRSAE
jgi:hypothetical protein